MKHQDHGWKREDTRGKGVEQRDPTRLLIVQIY